MEHETWVVIRPCPFCGDMPAIVDETSAARPIVECQRSACHAHPRVDGLFTEDAIRNWNWVMGQGSTSQFEKLTAFEKTEVSYSSGVGGKGDE